MSSVNTVGIRTVGTNMLSSYLSIQNNIDIIEKMIFELCTIDDITDDDMYKSLLYQTCNDISNKLKLNDIYKNLQDKHVLWKHVNFNIVNTQIQDQISFIETPFEVEEGVLDCKKCSSKRVFSYSKQSRSADEPSTTYAECVVCKSKWQYNG